MPKLPELRKVTVLVFRRRGPDELLLVRKPSRDGRDFAPPYVLAEDGETPDAAARRFVEELAPGEIVGVIPLAIRNAFVVKNGPSAGDWKESFVGVEVGRDARPAQGVWLYHYEAKAQLSAVKTREAITELRTKAKLVP